MTAAMLDRLLHHAHIDCANGKLLVMITDPCSYR